MDAVEVGLFGLRTAVFRMRRSGHPLTFVVFAMVHYADHRYYEAISERIRDCDMAVVEGVRGSPGYRRRLLGRGRGLVRQHIDYAALGVPTINPDLTMADLRRECRSFSLLPRLGARLFFRMVRFLPYVFMFVSRDSAARALALNSEIHHAEMAWMQDNRVWGPVIRDLVLDARDARVTAQLASIHEAHSEKDLTVAIVYGAGHLFAIMDSLQALGYRSTTGEWLLAWDYDPPDPPTGRD